MNKSIFKNYKTVLFLSLFIPILSFGAGKQIQLNNGMWQPVGFQGIYEIDQYAASWETDFTRAIKDLADENTTYIRGSKNHSNNFYVSSDNNLSSDFTTNDFALSRHRRYLCDQRETIKKNLQLHHLRWLTRKLYPPQDRIDTREDLQYAYVQNVHRG